MEEEKDFYLFHSVQIACGAQPASYTLDKWIKRPGFEADYSSASSVEVKNSGAVPLLPNKSSCRGA
jgi:hypothetical protein